jgi:uncharacterized membrane protein
MEWTDTIDIDSPPDIVWTLNTDVEHWPAYTPTMTSVRRLDTGPFRVGSRARIKQPGQPIAVWTVTDLAAGREFRWRSHRRGLTLTGGHLVEPVTEQSRNTATRNTVTLQADGPLAALFGLTFGPLIRRSLRIENNGFKTHAERLHAGGLRCAAGPRRAARATPST